MFTDYALLILFFRKFPVADHFLVQVRFLVAQQFLLENAYQILLEFGCY